MTKTERVKDALLWTAIGVALTIVYEVAQVVIGSLL